jgi:hypothetical protein
MERRTAGGQASSELVVLVALLVGAALALGAALARAGVATEVVAALRGVIAREHPRHGDRWAIASASWGALVRRYSPRLVLERDSYGQDEAVPVDFVACRQPRCARVGVARPTAFVHVVRRAAVVYLEFWLYYPDSRGAHLPVPALRGYHRDDWEGVLVRIDAHGATARATAHLGLQGVRPWWASDPGWHPIGPHPTVYRASGSHANGFSRDDLDLAGDAWNGALATVTLADLEPADEAPARRARFDPEASPPWHKLLWRHPEATTTAADADRGLAWGAARAWALLLGKG